MTILLIEDDESIGSLLRLVLSRQGYTTLLVRSVAEARNVWSAYHAIVNLVITDNSLPDGSGLSLAIEFRTENPALAVILISGTEVSQLPFGFVQLNKPFELLELTRAVNRAIGQPAPNPPPIPDHPSL